MTTWIRIGIIALLGVIGAAPSVRAAEIDVRKNIVYYTGADADRYAHRLDLYLPKGQKGVPVMIFVYGGGWTTGNKDMSTYVRIGETFAARGVATAVINYRLTPKVTHPGHVQDVARAFAWVYGHIAEYGGRPDQIVLCGHSAGGHLVALLATDPVYLREVGRSIDDIKIVVPISGVYTLGTGLRLYRAAFGSDPDVLREASPINHVAGHHPPFLILYGDRDVRPMRVDSEKMARELKAAGADVEIHQIGGHGHLQMVLEIPAAGDPIAPAVLDFIARHR